MASILKMIIKKFNKTTIGCPSKWNITEFLEVCDLELFDRKIESYIASLEAIANMEEGKKRKKAQLLLDNYKEQGKRPDFTKKNHDDNKTIKLDLNDEINNFFQNPPEQESTNPIKKRWRSEIVSNERGIPNEAGNKKGKFEEQESIFTSEDEDSDYIPSGAEDQSPPSLLLSSQLKEFQESYEKMNVAQKWFLSSGKCVEDTIYEHSTSKPQHTTR
ncbi:hypothetical protein GLOIN_2v1495160 [Rhizophagus clarus]|uniref:Uncharacterized protein n=1 Tax=Rhizophagus clarus TaxID=94130 RepID=A0A8H3QHU9_9GLOM|nr:hypothetical protein GLOIN_2v1495160 [Rhizophagus clarus]